MWWLCVGIVFVFARGWVAFYVGNIVILFSVMVFDDELVCQGGNVDLIVLYLMSSDGFEDTCLLVFFCCNGFLLGY